MSLVEPEVGEMRKVLPPSRRSHLGSPHIQQILQHHHPLALGKKKDSPFTPSSDLRSSGSDVDEGLWLKYCTDPKYVVFGSQLDRIFYSMECTAVGVIFQI